MRLQSKRRLLTPFIKNMKITNLYKEENPVAERAVRRCGKNGDAEEAEVSLISEHILDIYVNEVLVMKAVCTPTALPALAVGRLLTEGFIDRADDIERIHVCEYGRRARVFLKNGVSPADLSEIGSAVSLTPTCCTDNRILRPELVKPFARGTAGPAGEEELPRRKDDAGSPVKSWTPEDIFLCAAHFAEDSTLHRKTRSTHSAFLVKNGQILYEAEDIGRHNAIDKVIGMALIGGTELSEAILFTTGRMPLDIVRKVIRAKIPVLVSKEVPTAEGCALAEEYGVTLIGKVRSESYIIFS